jgi:hypothetical protein
MLETRHIQELDANSTIKHYWGYADRILPCTKDAGTCAYLDSLRYGKSVTRSSNIKTPLRRGLDSLGSLGRRWMLSEAPGRGFLGRVTLLQVTVLSALLGYLLIFSYVYCTYV